MPPRIFDSHLHIIDPAYPLVENQGYLPETFSVADYRRRTAAFNIQGGAVVSGSFQGFDQSYLEDALRRLGPGFVGVTQIPAEADDAEIKRLDKIGVRAVRFNLKRGGSAHLSRLENLGRRVYDLAGWHTELYVDSGELGGLKQTLLNLPRVSIDHLGLSATGLQDLYELVERGVMVKATGFGRVSLDVDRVIKTIDEINPGALMFGTDLPSTRAVRPFLDEDLERIQNILGEEGCDRAFYENAARLYGLLL